MIKYSSHFFIVFFALSINASAQINVQPAIIKKIILPYKIPEVSSTIKKIEPVQIASKKINSINVQPRFGASSSNAQCALLKNITSALELKGERLVTTAVNLTWLAKDLYDKKGFEIERSDFDTMHFKKVAYISAYSKPSSKEEYKLIDANNSIQITYYRLKQVKLDTGFAYSNIISVTGIPQFGIFPNPVSDILYLKLQSTKNIHANIMVFDSKAVLLLQQPAELIKNINNIKSINVHSLTAGLYMIKVNNADTTIYAQKFIKQ